jgi:hypothetical protein
MQIGDLSRNDKGFSEIAYSFMIEPNSARSGI